MGLSNFIRNVFIANVLLAKEKIQVFAGVANTNYEGTIVNLGDEVTIPMVSDPTFTPYEKNTKLDAPEVLADAVTKLKIDQAQKFNVGVDDSEANQLNLITQLQNKTAYQMKNIQDTYMASLYSQAGLSLYTNDAPLDIDSLNAEDAIAEVVEYMNENDIQLENRFGIVSPWFYNKLWLAGLTTKTSNDLLYSNGQIGIINGLDLRMSNNVSKNSTAWDKTRMIFGIKNESLTTVLKIMKVENYRHPDYFQENIKGWCMYGGKVARPDKTVVLYADKKAET